MTRLYTEKNHKIHTGEGKEHAVTSRHKLSCLEYRIKTRKTKCTNKVTNKIHKGDSIGISSYSNNIKQQVIIQF